jgi:hypothetical protein
LLRLGIAATQFYGMAHLGVAMICEGLALINKGLKKVWKGWRKVCEGVAVATRQMKVFVAELKSES